MEVKLLIGIVSDIHDAVVPLRNALSLLRERRVDRIVTLGDAFDSFKPGDPGVEIAELLRVVDAVGVWGNHDFGLRQGGNARIRDRADPSLLLFASRLQPQLVIGDCRFSHIEPWKDVSRLEDLWSFNGIPDTIERAQRSFQAVPERILFVGHFHLRLVLHKNGIRVWNENQTIQLRPPNRYLVLVPAVQDGWCAMFHSGRSELSVIQCSM